MGKVRNLFAVSVHRYKHKAPFRRQHFDAAKSVWDPTSISISDPCYLKPRPKPFLCTIYVKLTMPVTALINKAPIITRGGTFSINKTEKYTPICQHMKSFNMTTAKTKWELMLT
jgi:hypothetical protein